MPGQSIPQQSTDLPASSDKARSSHRRRKYAWRILLSLLLVLMVLVLLLPKLLSTSYGTTSLVSIVNRRIAGRVHIVNLDLRWSAGQLVEGVDLVHPDGSKVMTIDRIELPEMSLWSYLRGDHYYGPIIVGSPQGQIDQVKEVLRRKRRPQVHKGSRPPRPVASRQMDVPAFNAKIEIQNANLSYEDDRIARIDLTMPDVLVDLRDPSRIELSLEATVRAILRDGATPRPIEGHIVASGIIRNLFDQGGRWQLRGARFKNTAVKISNVPTSFFAALLKQKLGEVRLLDQDNALETLIGPTLALQLHVDGDMASLEAGLTIASDRLSVQANLRGRPDGLTIVSPAELRWHVDDRAWDILAGSVDFMHDTRLVQPFDVRTTLKRFQIDFDDQNRPLLAQGELEFIGENDDIVLDAPDPIGKLTLHTKSLQLSSDKLGEQIHAVFQAVVEQGGNRGTLDMNAQIRHAFDANQRFDQKGLRAKFDATLHDLPMAVFDQFAPKLKEMIRPSLGPTLRLELTAQLETEEDALWAIRYDLAVEGERIQANIAGDLDRHRLVVRHGSATLTVTPDVVDGWRNVIQDSQDDQLPFPYVSLASPTVAHMEVRDLELPWKDGVCEISSVISLTLDQVRPSGIKRLESAALNDIELKINDFSTARPFYFNAKADLAVDAAHVDIKAWGTVGKLFDGEPAVDSTLLAKEIPVKLIERVVDRLGSLEGVLPDRIGHVEINLANDSSQSKKIRVRIGLRAANDLQATLEGVIVGQERLTLSDASKITYNLTPERFASWLERPGESNHQNRWQLLQPAQLQLHVKQAHVIRRQLNEDTQSTSPIDPELTKFTVDLSMTQLRLQRKQDPDPLPIKALFATIQADGMLHPMAITVRTESDDKQDAAEESELNIDVKLKVVDLITADARFNPALAAYQIDRGRFTRLPVDLIDRLARQNGQLVSIVGMIADLNVHGRIDPQQPAMLDLELHGEHAHGMVACLVGRNGTLRKDGELQIDVTPQLSTHLLKKINPMISAVSGQAPVKVIIRSEGFFTPIQAFDLAKVKADIDLELGTLVLDRSDKFEGQALGALVDGLSKLFKLDRQSRGTRHTAVFTPLRLHLENGIVSYPTMKMSLDGIVLSFRGNIDVVHDRVDLLVGLTGKSFLKFDKYAKFVRPTDTFEVRMVGPTNQVEISFDVLFEQLINLGLERGIEAGLGELLGREKDKPWGAILERILQGSEYKSKQVDGEEEPDKVRKDPLGSLLERVLREGSRREKQKKQKRKKERQK